jgi:hypothetical protein
MTRLLACLSALLLCAGAASAVPMAYATRLTGPKEFPSVDSPGTGTALVIIDTDAHTLFVDVDWSGLVSPTTVAHVHCCVDPEAAVPTAGVATTTPTFPGFPAGVMAGAYSQTFDLTLASSFNAAFVTANGGTPAGAEAALAAGLEAGFAYFNIHSMQFGTGEIRGFLPEPAAGLLTAAAALGLALARRRGAG